MIDIELILYYSIVSLFQREDALQVDEVDLSTNNADQRLLRELELHDADWVPGQFQDDGEALGVPDPAASGPGRQTV